MSQSMSIVWRPAVVTGLAAGLLFVPAGAALASWGEPVRVTGASAFNTQPVKTAVATCPEDSVRYAGGGMVNYGPGGGGGVALTAVLPDLQGHAIAVTAAAPAGHAGPWSVTAVAICNSSVEPWRITVQGAGTATATCPEQTRVFGLGFRIEGDPAAAHVRELSLDQDLSRVRVRAGGPAGDSTEVTAIALCRPPAQMERGRTTAVGAGWPVSAIRPDTDPERSAYATGATVTGSAAATLDAVMPGADGQPTMARGTLVGGPAGSGARLTADGDDEGGSVTMDVTFSGTFH